MGDPVPIMKGWLRVSLREVNENHPFHCDYLPHRDYASADTLVLEIAGRDTQGIGKILPQAPPDDRDPRVFDGLNPLELGKEDSWLLLPSFRLGKRAPVIV
ncbi:hypothetical protein CNMCM8812_008356 [Aspergillus fumigatus]|nr:hypothetical protein CNMCM8812_008356 [Aspergillus fumigatus]KAH1613605.1 hypothetical protein KXX21_001829 [Aspergillus fumigatus]KAH1631002.1 hypothetical protein KXX39_001959 [Aspergillus fumigatus]KAH2982742.1 hypothetical protein KXV25_002105 [Aspergillus fumigatus]